MRGAWQATIVNDSGDVQPFAAVEVRDQAGALVNLFDAAEGGSAISNPFDADNEGFAQFYCDPQLVDIEATTASGIRTWDKVLIAGTAAVADIPDGAPSFGTAAVADIPDGAPSFGTAAVADVGTGTGELLDADTGYWPGNILGAVSQSGGVPTGAIIERGSNSDGEYVKFADGTAFAKQNIDKDGDGSDTVNVSSSESEPAFTAWSDTPVVQAAISYNGSVDPLVTAFRVGGPNSSGGSTIEAVFASTVSSSNSVKFQIFWMGEWY